MAPCPGGSGSSPRSPPSPVSAEPLSSQVPPACPGAGQDFGELLLVELQLCVSPLSCLSRSLGMAAPFGVNQPRASFPREAPGRSPKPIPTSRTPKPHPGGICGVSAALPFRFQLFPRKEAAPKLRRGRPGELLQPKLGKYFPGLKNNS